MFHLPRDYTRHPSSAEFKMATWSQLGTTIHSGLSVPWEGVRAIRLDGPTASPKHLRGLVDAGLLEAIERIELCAEAVSAPALSALQSLPCLTELRLEGATLERPLEAYFGALRSLELIRCSPQLCVDLLERAPNLRQVIVKAPPNEGGQENQLVLEALAAHQLAAMTLADLQAPYRAFAGVLRSLAPRLGRLQLHEVVGLESTEWLNDTEWPELTEFAWTSAEAQTLRAPLPDQLRSLDLRFTKLMSVEPNVLPAHLQALDVRNAQLPDVLAARVRERAPCWRSLRLSASRWSESLVGAIAVDPNSALVELQLERGPATDGHWDSHSPPTGLHRLERIAVSGWSLSHHLWSALLAGAGAPRLESLAWRGHLYFDDDTMARLSPKLRHLELRGGGRVLLHQPEQTLGLEAVQISGLEIEGDPEAFIARCPHIRAIGVRHKGRVAPDWLQGVLASIGPQLQALTLNDFYFEDNPDHAAQLNDALQAATFPCLRTLEIDDSEVSIETLRHLAARETCPKLRTLRFGPDPDGDEPWHALSAASPDLHHVTGPGQGRMNERLAILRESPLAHAIVSFEDF